MYQCSATSLGGFIQQLAACYVGRGYWFYVPGSVPQDKAAEDIDRKLIAKYGIDISKYQRCRRKRAGQASIQYLRYGRHFFLLATHGEHGFFREEANVINDVRRNPIRFGGYSIGYRDGHPRVGLTQETYRDLNAWFLETAAHRRAGRIEDALRQLPYEPYAGVRRQLFSILRQTNRVRRKAGYAPIPGECVRLKRRIYRPFEAIAPETTPPGCANPRPCPTEASGNTT